MYSLDFNAFCIYPCISTNFNSIVRLKIMLLKGITISVTSSIGDILFVSRLSNYVYPPSDGDIVYIQSIHHKSLYMLLVLYFKWNSSKLCILAHYDMTIGLLLQQLIRTIFEGVISLFHLE
jgi:hypothetical protein